MKRSLGSHEAFRLGGIRMGSGGGLDKKRILSIILYGGRRICIVRSPYIVIIRLANDI